MSQVEEASAHQPIGRLKGAAENLERIRRRIGPFMPSRVDTPIPPGSDWKGTDRHADLALDNREGCG